MTARVVAKTLPHILASPNRHILKRRPKLDLSVASARFEHAEGANLVEITLERSLSADVQSHTMGPAAKKFGVPQFERDDIEAFLFQKSHE
jgi:hypothetical protein